MKIGFIIVNYNDADTTQILLNNIKNYNSIDLILVVDNNSTDNSYNVLKELENTHIKVVNTMSNKGYGSAINYGAKYLKKIGITWSFISNPDVVIENESVIKQLIDDINEDNAWIAPIIKEHQGLNRGFKVEKPMDSILLSLPYFYRKFISKIHYNESYYVKGLLPVEALSGCFFLLSLDILEKVDYFDENVFLYYEENILAKKIGKTKKKIILDTRTSVFHNHSVTIDKNLNRIKKYKALKKSQRYFQKEYNNANFLILGIHWMIEKMTILALEINQLFRH